MQQANAFLMLHCSSSLGQFVSTAKFDVVRHNASFCATDVHLKHTKAHADLHLDSV